MAVHLDLYAMTLHVIEEEPDSHPYCAGEVLVTLDSDETAWVEPCSRLVMTEEIVDRLADRLRPYGVRWMRGWHDGRWRGRVITAHGTRGVAGVDVHGHAGAGGPGEPGLINSGDEADG
jgi:hypothetical protein